ncbi:MAG: hypothetical protein V3W05_06670, partial [candidate division NC10 bacterium]
MANVIVVGTQWGDEGNTHAIRNQHRAKPKRNNALWVAEQLTIKLHIIDVIEEYKDVVINPKH